MSDEAPERRWVDTFSKNDRAPDWFKDPPWAATEYVRADQLYATLATNRELVRQLAEVRKAGDALADALDAGYDSRGELITELLENYNATTAKETK